jgi:hypothetical protein
LLDFFSTSPLHTITAVHNIAARMPGVVASWVSEVDVPATVEASVAAKVVVSEIVYAPKRAPKGASKGNQRARKNDDAFFMAYEWATRRKPRIENATDLQDARKQRAKLYNAALNQKGVCKETSEEFLRIMKGKIDDGAKRLGRYTKKSEALNEANVAKEIHRENQGTIEADFSLRLDRSMLPSSGHDSGSFTCLPDSGACASWQLLVSSAPKYSQVI